MWWSLRASSASVKLCRYSGLFCSSDGNAKVNNFSSAQDGIPRRRGEAREGECGGEGKQVQERAAASARGQETSGSAAARAGESGGERARDGRSAAALKTEKGARGREKVRSRDLGRLFSSAALRPTKINAVFSSAPLKPTKMDGVLSSA